MTTLPEQKNPDTITLFDRENGKCVKNKKHKKVKNVMAALIEIEKPNNKKTKKNK
jgi:hypothetical protein